MKKSYLLFVLLALASCEKDIHIDYHEIEPMLVVEGGITDGGCDVRLSSTMEMAYPDGASPVKGARVVITSLDDGHSSPLVYQKYGHYQSSFKGEPARPIGWTFGMATSISRLSPPCHISRSSVRSTSSGRKWWACAS